jgi:hypothetical protein
MGRPDAIADALLAGKAHGMTEDDLLALLSTRATPGEAPAGEPWLQFQMGGVTLACIVDARTDRMRLLAPIIEVSELPGGALAVLMEANFHTALDGRYGTSDGIVYALYHHPLAALDAEQLDDAIGQVVRLVQTFGTSFSSSDLVFGAANRDDETEN